MARLAACPSPAAIASSTARCSATSRRVPAAVRRVRCLKSDQGRRRMITASRSTRMTRTGLWVAPATARWKPISASEASSPASPSSACCSIASYECREVALGPLRRRCVGADWLDAASSRDHVERTVLPGQGRLGAQEGCLGEPGLGDVGPASRANVENARVLEHADRLAHRAATHRESRREQALRRERRAGGERARFHALENLLDDREIEPRTIDGLKFERHRA